MQLVDSKSVKWCADFSKVSDERYHRRIVLRMEEGTRIRLFVSVERCICGIRLFDRCKKRKDQG